MGGPDNEVLWTWSLGLIKEKGDGVLVNEGPLTWVVLRNEMLWTWSWD